MFRLSADHHALHPLTSGRFDLDIEDSSSPCSWYALLHGSMVFVLPLSNFCNFYLIDMFIGLLFVRNEGAVLASNLYYLNNKTVIWYS
ncbi:hypothetical protein BRADI_3g17305v3 [Brachypodium distachyon]|uniref:Uncharacterized protein n=1 Tax=Brachypodium distachyon TaxID=15368 RepID=A0A2K2CXQ9_BRADI|nr:hypothetical protein BRADI_3g17305v3 [Brachypodium distachyon]